MITLRCAAAFLALALSSLPLWAQDDNPIVLQMSALVSAYNAGDPVAVSAIYAEDGAIFAPTAKAMVGREAIAAHFKAALDGGVTEMGFQVQEIRSYGQGAVEIGESVVTLGGKRIISRYLHVWENKDGRWLLARDIYNVVGTIE